MMFYLTYCFMEVQSTVRWGMIPKFRTTKRFSLENHLIRSNLPNESRGLLSSKSDGWWLSAVFWWIRSDKNRCFLIRMHMQYLTRHPTLYLYTDFLYFCDQPGKGLCQFKQSFNVQCIEILFNISVWSEVCILWLGVYFYFVENSGHSW